MLAAITWVPTSRCTRITKRQSSPGSGYHNFVGKVSDMQLEGDKKLLEANEYEIEMLKTLDAGISRISSTSFQYTYKL